ncbi:MAG: 2-oxoacid:acceptor oxidoreductase subunit alpha [Candidatus Peregrinibacteria bacterium]
MKKGNLNILIGGAAGSGIEKSGHTLTTSFVRGGYKVFANVEHMSQIRHGNNFLRLRIDKVPHASHVEEIDIMVALDRQTIDEHLDEMSEGGVVIFDGEMMKADENEAAAGSAEGAGKATMIDVPLKKLAEERLGNPIMANVITLGIICRISGFDIETMKQVLGKIFAKKGAEIIKLNEKAAEIGYELGEKWEKDFPVKMPAEKSEQQMFLMGNDATAMGAMKAGVKYVGEYPMTPSSSILHLMAVWSEKYEIVVKQTEDEIAACNSIIGAGFAGVRAMAATSGGGFALMTEAVGLAGMNEVPVVIVNVMRPGPATGLPTRTEQGDLRQVIHGGQGDPVKIVILPGDVEECFSFGFEAFNLAEKYQMPVIICYDKHLGEGYFTAPPFDESGMKIDRGKIPTEKELAKTGEYKRYLRTEDGISPRAIPGMKGGIHRATSDEHNEYGDIFEDAENRKLMMEKRMKKVEAAVADTFKPLLIGDENADVTFVTWGSGKGICLEAAEILGGQDVKANVLQIRTAWPFHKKEVLEILKKCKRPVLVEHNYTGQMGGLIAEKTGIMIEEKVLRYDGRPMTAKYVIDRIKL